LPLFLHRPKSENHAIKKQNQPHFLGLSHNLQSRIYAITHLLYRRQEIPEFLIEINLISHI
jgi:hypothetical protein